MLVRVQNTEALSGAERFVVRLLREWGTGTQTLGGVAVFQCHVPRVRRGRAAGSEIDVLVWTPRGCTVVEIKGFGSVQHGVLEVKVNGRWQVGGQPADVHAKSAPNPLLQARKYMFDVKTLFQQHDLPSWIEMLVVLVPKTGSRITWSGAGMEPGTDLVLVRIGRSRPLLEYFRGSSAGPPRWTIDDVEQAFRVLELGDYLPTRAQLAAEGFLGQIGESGADEEPIIDDAPPANPEPDYAAETPVSEVGDSDGVPGVDQTAAAPISGAAETAPPPEPAPAAAAEFLTQPYENPDADQRRQRVSDGETPELPGPSSPPAANSAHAPRPTADPPPVESASIPVSRTDLPKSPPVSPPVTPLDVEKPAVVARGRWHIAANHWSRQVRGRLSAPRASTVVGVGVAVAATLVLTSFAAFGIARFDITQYAGMCQSPKRFTQAAEYRPDRPSPVYLAGELGAFDGAKDSPVWFPRDPSTVQLVACMTYLRTDALAKTCQYPPEDGQRIGRTLNLFRAVYRVDLYNAGNAALLSSSEVVGDRFAPPDGVEYADPCRSAAGAPEEGLPGRRHSRPSARQVMTLLRPFVHPDR